MRPLSSGSLGSRGMAKRKFVSCSTILRWSLVVLLLAFSFCCTGFVSAKAQAAPAQSKSTTADLAPLPAVPATLALFDKYEVVGLPQGHGMQDLDDFIFSLIRNPAFSEKVNDIEFECGNAL